MTAVDPTPTATGRRLALDRLAELREDVADFLDRPSTDGLRQMTDAVQAFVQFEADQVLPQWGSVELEVGHDALAGRLNRLCWAQPGGEVQTEAHLLRHEVLAQLDRYQALRMPRGAIISPP
jgi:hypothetical protein